MILTIILFVISLGTMVYFFKRLEKIMTETKEPTQCLGCKFEKCQNVCNSDKIIEEVNKKVEELKESFIEDLDNINLHVIEK